MRRITTVTFDLWQTLILDTPESSRPRARLRQDGTLAALRDEGYDFTREQVVEAYRRCYQICDEIRQTEGDVSFDEQIDLFLKSIDQDMAARLSPETWQRVARSYADSYLQHPPQIDEDAGPVLHMLKEQGFRLGLICNTGATPGATQRVFLQQAGLARYFATLTFSDEEGLSKPSTRIFHVTLERMGAAPHEAVHVGDHPRNDVEGAKRAGLAAIWLRRDDQVAVVPPDACVSALDQVPEAVARLAA